jgi:hypothetical protein
LYFFDPVKKHYYDIIDTATLEIKGKTTLAMLHTRRRKWSSMHPCTIPAEDGLRTD